MLDELSEGEAEEEERQLENIKKIILDDLQSEGTDNKKTKQATFFIQK